VQSGPAVAGPEGLVALLSYVPRATLDAGEGSGVHWYYADLAQQFDAVGVPRTELLGQMRRTKPGLQR